jgi:hypothetical protein
LAAIAGCTSSGGVGGSSPLPSAPTSAQGSPQPSGSADAVCAAADQLKASIQSLTTLNSSSDLTQLQTTINNIETSLNNFASTAQSEFGPQTTALKTAVSNLKAAINAAGPNPGSSQVNAITTAAAGVVSAYTSLQQAVSARCG